MTAAFRFDVWEEKLRPEAGIPFFQNIISQVFIGAALLFNAVAWALPLVFVSRERDIVILHYNVYFGVDLVGFYWQLLIPAALGLVFLAAHVALSAFLYNRAKDRVAAYLLLLGAAFVEFSVAVAAGALSLVNY